MRLVVARAEGAVGMDGHHRIARADDVAGLVEFELERAEQHQIAGVHERGQPCARRSGRAVVIDRRITPFEIIGHRRLGPQDQAWGVILGRGQPRELGEIGIGFRTHPLVFLPDIGLDHGYRDGFRRWRVSRVDGCVDKIANYAGLYKYRCNESRGDQYSAENDGRKRAIL